MDKLQIRPALVRLVRLTRREYFADFFITPPITLGLAALSLWRDRSLAWPLLFVTGIVTWTLYEYLVHRFVSHDTPLFRELHGLHHARQLDYIAVHPLLTVATYVLLWLAFGFRGSAFMVGFSAGYVTYSAMHTAFHYARVRPGSALYAAKRRHALHHRHENSNFGIVTGVWDKIFRTEFPRA